jgi:hypothetical protein
MDKENISVGKLELIYPGPPGEEAFADGLRMWARQVREMIDNRLSGYVGAHNLGKMGETIISRTVKSATKYCQARGIRATITNTSDTIRIEFPKEADEEKPPCQT